MHGPNVIILVQKDSSLSELLNGILRFDISCIQTEI